MKYNQMLIKAIAKQLTAKQAFGPTVRYNPFQKDIEIKFFS